MMSILIRLATSRFGLAAIALMAALSWHYIDKAAAVRSAEEKLADEVTIQTLEAERDAARQQAEQAEAARDRLAGEVMRAAEDAAQLRKELEEYEQGTTVNPDGVVDGSVLERLRNR
jgi:hypothetical protein